ncbi:MULTISPECIES: hypothetical protein [unclassified Burkholderia]|uniref:hypothetical protein n=1 Tax=unclassified Burkholderia TaxID=2613784 RepID=UPI000F5B84AB|nr:MULTISPECIES: hypothetical protein [unclassified Burkholderia]
MSIYTGQYGGTIGCKVPPVTFTPVAGQDYDVFLDTERRACSTVIRRIDKDGLDQQVPAITAKKCSASMQPNSAAAK